MPWQQENSNAVQVQERLLIKPKELKIYFLKTMFPSRSLGVTLRCMYTSVEDTDTENNVGKARPMIMRRNQSKDQFRQKAEIWTHSRANEVIANEPSKRVWVKHGFAIFSSLFKRGQLHRVESLRRPDNVLRENMVLYNFVYMSTYIWIYMGYQGWFLPVHGILYWPSSLPIPHNYWRPREWESFMLLCFDRNLLVVKHTHLLCDPSPL